MYYYYRRQLSRLLMRAGGIGTFNLAILTQTTTRSYAPATSHRSSSNSSKHETTTTATTPATTAPAAKIDLNKTLDDIKAANEAVGGPLKRDEAFALLALLAREVVKEQTKGNPGGGSGTSRLKSTQISPPLSALRTRERAKRFLEYATLCEVSRLLCLVFLKLIGSIMFHCLA